MPTDKPDYRPFLPAPGTKIMGPTARAHAKARTDTPRSREFWAARLATLERPFVGITPNGNDYGIDLLCQHYARSPHHKGRA